MNGMHTPGIGSTGTTDTTGPSPRSSRSMSSWSQEPQREMVTPRRRRALNGAAQRARGLGWFSVGLGLTQLVAPRALARAIGVGSGPSPSLTMRALGVRELMTGVGILRGRNPSPWLWARVLGDVMDLGLLALVMRSSEQTKVSRRDRVPVAMLAVAGVTALDLFTSRQVSRDPFAQRVRGEGRQPVEIRSTITVNRSPDEVYSFWRDFQNLSRFMNNVRSVQVLDQLRSRWTVEVAGKTLEWDAEITDDRPNELIAWRTLRNADVTNSGEVRFIRAPGGRGTEVHVTIQVRLPGGALGRAAAKLGQKLPEQEVASDLLRLKQVMELGEVTRSDASIHRGPHPARPSRRTR